MRPTIGTLLLLVQPCAAARTIVREYSLYPASRWIAATHPPFVNATTYYSKHMQAFCSGPIAGVADQIVVMPEQFELSSYLCTIEDIYLHVQQSGAAALMFMQDRCAGEVEILHKALGCLGFVEANLFGKSEVAC